MPSEAHALQFKTTLVSCCFWIDWYNWFSAWSCYLLGANRYSVIKQQRKFNKRFFFLTFSSTPKIFFFSELDSVVSILGRDAALLGTNENQYAILDEDRSGLVLFVLPGPAFQEVSESNGAIDVNSSNSQHGPDRGSQHFFFETEVDRIFSFPLGWV